MNQLPESFAKAATKQRFQDLISGRSRSRKTSSSNASIQEVDQPLSPNSNHSEDKVTVEKEVTTYEVPFSPTNAPRPDSAPSFPAENHGDFNRGSSPDLVNNSAEIISDRFRPEYNEEPEVSPTPLSPPSRGQTASSSGSRILSDGHMRNAQVVSPIAYVERRVTSQSQLSPLSDHRNKVTSRQLSRNSMDLSSRGNMPDTVIQMTEFPRVKIPSVMSIEVENEVENLSQPPIRPRRRKDSSLVDVRTSEVSTPSLQHEKPPSVALEAMTGEDSKTSRLYRKRRQAAEVVDRTDTRPSIPPEDSRLVSHYGRTTWTSTSGPETPATGDAFELLPKDSQKARLSRLRSKVVTAQEHLHQAGEPTALNGQASEPHGEPRILSVEEQEPKKTDAPEKVLGVKIHRTDKLVGHYDLPNVLVRISVLDGQTGKFLPRSTRNEVQGARSSPVMTGICDLSATGLAFPAWEEMVILNDELSQFFQISQNVMLFELCTFKPFGNLTGNSDAEKNDPFHCFAWAFLKLTESTLKMVKTNRRIRLQLFKPGKVLLSKSSPVDTPHVYRWWKAKHHSKYSATLHVTLTELTQAASGEPSVQPDVANSTYQHLKSLFGIRSSVTDAFAGREDMLRLQANEKGVSKHDSSDGARSRVLAGPDAVSFSIDVSPQGVSAVRFSPDGRSLACGGLEKAGVGCVKVYEIPGGTVKGVFRQLRGIVYGLEWSPSSHVLLCACADGTVKLWNTLTFHPKPMISLPHPGFVYCASFHPQSTSVVASGCFDGVIRIWSVHLEKSTYALLQELTGHVGLVNVVVFNLSGDQLYSGGSDGLIRQWSQDPSPDSAPLFQYRLANTTPTGLSQNVVIVDLKVRHEANQLICVTQNGDLSFVDLNGFALLRQITFSQPFKYRIRGALTPDESRLYIGSVRSEVQIVDLDTAKLVQTTGSGLSCGVPVDIDYHPTQHMTAFCALGLGEKVVVRTTSTPKQVLPSESTKLHVPAERSLATSPCGTSQTDKVSEVIQKLDAITDDMKQREQLRSRTPLATSIRTSADRWRSDLLYSATRETTLEGLPPTNLPAKLMAGLMPNFSQFGVSARPHP